MAEIKIIPLILCGGEGSRLWPLSRRSYPKQFLALNRDSDKTLLQQTQERILSVKNVSEPILICNEEHRFLVAEQMRKISINPMHIILEPFGRNTAPAITLGALKSLESNEDCVLLVLSADHKIDNLSKFVNCINKGYEYACNGRLVTFGVIPTYPETGYGYIEGEKEFEVNIVEGIPIKNFIEKPDQQKAEELFGKRNYTWNSGIFMFRASVILNEISKNSPLVFESCKNAVAGSSEDLDFLRINNNEFKKSPNISIDIAVMEKTNLGTVIPLDAGWSDIGSWKSLWESEKKDTYGNLINGKVVDDGSKNCLLRSDNRLLVTLGLKDLIVVETTDAVLVSSKNKAKELKLILKKLDKKGYKEITSHRKVYRPWGNYTSIAEDKSWQVKRIEVKPNSILSLQMHHHRAEHWVVVSGTAKVEIDNKSYLLGENKSIFIPLGSKHRLHNPGKIPLILIEVQSGQYLGEDDIIRFEDLYGRQDEGINNY